MYSSHCATESSCKSKLSGEKPMKKRISSGSGSAHSTLTSITTPSISEEHVSGKEDKVVGIRICKYWRLYFDVIMQRYYFFNTKTKRSQWHWKRDSENVFLLVDQEMEMAEWRICFENKFKRYFFYNLTKNTSTWVLPPHLHLIKKNQVRKNKTKQRSKSLTLQIEKDVTKKRTFSSAEEMVKHIRHSLGHNNDDQESLIGDQNDHLRKYDSFELLHHQQSSDEEKNNKTEHAKIEKEHKREFFLRRYSSELLETVRTQSADLFKSMSFSLHSEHTKSFTASDADSDLHAEWSS